MGGCSGGGNNHRYDCGVDIMVDFPSREKRITAKTHRLKTLLQIARLADYQVDTAWRAALRTHGKDGWRALLGATEQEKGFEALISEWISHEYRINRDDPKLIFERICKEVDTQKFYSPSLPQGLAIGMIYEKLDYRSLIEKFERVIKGKMNLNNGYSTIQVSQKKRVLEYNHGPREYTYRERETVPASMSAIRHVLQLWDRKLDAENADPDNPIEKAITPAILIYRPDLDLASEFGGYVYEQYLLRHYRREQRVEGRELGPENFEFEGGLFLNKWLWRLVRLNTPAGQSFRSRNPIVTEKMARLLLNTRFEDAREPPGFLFLDLDRGQRGLAFTFWKEYILTSEDAFGREIDRFKRRLLYLAHLGNLATDVMYKECWRHVSFEDLFSPEGLGETLNVAPTDRKIFMAHYILDDIQKEGIDNRDKVNAIRGLKLFLAREGDEQALQEFQEKTTSKTSQDDYARYFECKEYVRYFVNSPVALNHPFIKVLSRHENPDMRTTVLPLIRKYPTPEHCRMLGDLRIDLDANVKQLAEETFTELERIRELPLTALVAYPSGS